MNYSQSTEVLNDFIRWSRNIEVRKRRLRSEFERLDLVTRQMIYRFGILDIVYG